MDKKYKIIIVDDHPLFREGIRLLIEKENIGEVIGVAENGLEFLNLLETLNPDLVLMDIVMPVMNGLEATRQAKKIRPDLKILVLTMSDEAEQCADLINSGAIGFVNKGSDKAILEQAIQAVASGSNYYSTDILRSLAANFRQAPVIHQPPAPAVELSERELEILMYFCMGLSVSEIAEKIFRSVKTVEAHRSRLIEKTNTKNTLNLVLYAIKHQLVEI
jgi:DNA-binding NarL/FixJ family response regulator